MPTGVYPRKRVPLGSYLAKRIARAGSDVCWPWLGLTDRQGYGQASTPEYRRTRSAHRLAYTFFVGPIPAGLSVLHRCDNPICCNPDHLFLGTQADNMRDAAAKGRMHRGANAKLTPDAVRSIRARYAAGGVTQRCLADEFGVSHSTIGLVVNRLRWPYIP